jgi:hypothetical protein
MFRGRDQVIDLQLNRAEEMFALASTDLFSEFRNYLTGVEYCISVLRSQRAPRSVRLNLSLPPTAYEQDLPERLRPALRRYCDQRIRYNARERRAVQLGGLLSLWIGIPLAVIGYLLVIFEHDLVGHAGNIVLDTTGWVLVWVGVWYPLDTMFFTPLSYVREIRALRNLRDAEITVATSRPLTL